jgi:hypothetical protein
LIIAVDNAVVSEYGHITTYPSDADTAALQVPFSSGVIPNHTVLHQGPCDGRRWRGFKVRRGEGRLSRDDKD